MRAMRTGIGAAFALAVGLLAGACDSSGGGSTCFSPVQGPSDPSCSGFDTGLSCPVNLSAWYTCVCTGTGSDRSWVCTPADSTGTGGMGSGGATGSGGSSTGDAGAG